LGNINNEACQAFAWQASKEIKLSAKHPFLLKHPKNLQVKLWYSDNYVHHNCDRNEPASDSG
jgi:hypothetical protein